MEYRKFGNTYVIRIDRGEEIVASLKEICRKEKIFCASVQAIGAVDDFEIGLFNVETKKYCSEHYLFPAEVTSLLGTVTEKEGEPYLHLHMTAADADHKCYGGHLNSAVISATCEMVVTLIDGKVGRRSDAETGLNLFQF
jgi:predicted DNA-binding protein with PD1-like motif